MNDSVISIIESSDTIPLSDTSDYNKSETDSLVYSDTISNDTFLSDISGGDTLTNDSTLSDTLKPKKEESLDQPVDYTADDSIIVNLQTKTVYLFKNAKVVYGSQIITADYIEFNMKDNTFYASALPGASRDDELAKFPVFEDGSETFEADEISYNFKSKKGLIKEVYTEQGEGYLHSEKIKRHDNEHIHIKNGKYTTCDLQHPHFYLKLTKAEIIPDDKIVSGPAYMVVGDIPLYPLFLPFGFFPSTKTAQSGVIIPDYGEEQKRGYFIKDGGFYWAINDYLDFKTLGSYYSNGTWGLGAEARYVVRYRFNGNMDFDFFKEKFEIDDGLDMSYRQNMRLYWTHTQDPKANPYNRFSANVRFSTTDYDRNYSYNAAYLNNTQSSNISYSRLWPGGSPFSLSGNIRQSQNRNTGNHNFKLPELAFNISQLNPFQSKDATEKKWYNNFQVSYSSNFSNEIDVRDSLLFEGRGWDSDSFDYGFRHTLPLSFVYKPFSFSGSAKTGFGKVARKILVPLNTLTITPSMNYEGVLYNSTVRKYYEVDTDTAGNQTSRLVTETIREMKYGQVFYPRFSAG
jgi:lipopolysaccharide assembly outer membrane protein LptD (OstA)